MIQIADAAYSLRLGGFGKRLRGGGNGTVLNFRLDLAWWCPSLFVDLFQNAFADFRMRDGARGHFRHQLR